MSWPVTIFADEAAASFAEQASFIRAQGLDGIDVRNANGRNCLDLTPQDIEEIKASGIPVQSIGSPVNKVPLDPSLADQELDKFKKAVEIAHALGTRRIRIFSPEPDRTQDPDQIWSQVEDWLAPMVRHAADQNVRILHENDAEFYGAWPEEAKRLVHQFAGDHFRLIFDFANTVKLGLRPWDDWFPWVTPYLDTLHIKDAVESTQEIVPAGEGDGQILQTLQYLQTLNWNGPLTLEPHLSAVGPFGGYSGPQLCTQAQTALQSLINQLPTPN